MVYPGWLDGGAICTIDVGDSNLSKCQISIFLALFLHFLFILLIFFFFLSNEFIYECEEQVGLREIIISLFV